MTGVIFDCRIPGRYRILLVDAVTLGAWLLAGREGDHMKFGVDYIWIEPA